MTGYPETIAPLVMDSSHRRCATCAIPDETLVSTPETLGTTYDDDEIISSIPEHLNNEFGFSAKIPHAIACSNPGLMSIDTKRPYDKAHLCAGLLTYGTKSYSNAAVCMSDNAEAYSNAEAYEYSQSGPITGRLQTASASTSIYVPPRETTNQTASAIKPVHLPRLSKMKKVTDFGYQTKKIPKNMSSSGCQNIDIIRNAPIPGQGKNKTSAVILSNNTTSALKGFNHLSQLKGEKVGSPVAIPSLQATSNFSLIS